MPKNVSSNKTRPRDETKSGYAKNIRIFFGLEYFLADIDIRQTEHKIESEIK